MERKDFLRPKQFYVLFPINVYSKPDQNSDVIQKLPMGAIITIEYTIGDFGKLMPDDGFIKMDYVTIL